MCCYLKLEVYVKAAPYDFATLQLVYEHVQFNTQFCVYQIRLTIVT